MQVEDDSFGVAILFCHNLALHYSESKGLKQHRDLLLWAVHYSQDLVYRYSKHQKLARWDYLASASQRLAPVYK